jgi:hypothetical protein
VPVKRLLLRVISFGGRYTALVLVALCIWAVIAWIDLIPREPIIALFATLIVLPIGMAGFALLIGIVVAGFRRPRGPFLSREDAPGLWHMWDELGAARGVRLLSVDGQFNASIAERRRFAGLFGREVHMTVGLPLLMVLDKDSLSHVIAHEVAHQQLRHIAGLHKQAEFEQTLSTVFEVLPPDRTIFGALFGWLLSGLGDALHVENLRISRQCEIEANAHASQRASGASAARSEVAALGFAKAFTTSIVGPWEEAMLKGAMLPISPLRRLADGLDQFRSVATLKGAAAAAFAAPPDPASTHPSFPERLAALGHDKLPDIEPLGPPVADSMLSADALRREFARLGAHFDDHARAVMGLE